MSGNDAIARLWWSTDAWVVDNGLAAIDGLMAYGARIEGYRNGWWARRWETVKAELPPPAEDASPEAHVAWANAPTKTFRRQMIFMHRSAMPLAMFECGDEARVEPAWWHKEERRCRTMMATQAGITKIRARLSDETGYDELHTPEEISDAVKVLPAKSSGTRGLIALMNCTFLWPKSKRAPDAFALRTQ